MLLPHNVLKDGGNVIDRLLQCSRLLDRNSCIFDGCSTFPGNQSQIQGEDWEDVNLAPRNEVVEFPTRDQLHPCVLPLQPLQKPSLSSKPPLLSPKPRPGKGQPFSAPAEDTLLGQCCCQEESKTVEVNTWRRNFSDWSSCMEEVEQQSTAPAEASTTRSSETTTSKPPLSCASTSLESDREWTRGTGSSCPELPSDTICREVTPRHPFAPGPKRNRRSFLEMLMAPGDVLVVSGQGHLFEIGTVRGFMSHVMLVTSAPVSVSPVTLAKLRSLWSGSCMPELWRVATIECTRSVVGTHSAEMLLAVTPRDRQFRIFGELDKTGRVTLCCGMVELWQSPGDVRAALRADLINNVVAGLAASRACWSAATAFRAIVMSSGPVEKPTAVETLQEIQSCWCKPPICTSLVITFWQQYLCLLAAMHPMDCPDLEQQPQQQLQQRLWQFDVLPDALV